MKYLRDSYDLDYAWRAGNADHPKDPLHVVFVRAVHG
jgi:hypothetical protein